MADVGVVSLNVAQATEAATARPTMSTYWLLTEARRDADEVWLL